jgi:hypothetical protein
MSLVYLTFTRDLMLFVTDKHPVLFSRYNEETTDENRPAFIEWVKDEHPEVWQKFCAHMTKKRLEGDDTT